MGQGARSGEMPVSSELFNHTRWSLVAAVREGAAAGADPLAELSRSYWFPVYACIRRHGHPPEVAWRLSRGFFDWLAAEIRRDRPSAFGRFRVFLFDRLQSFLSAPDVAEAQAEVPPEELVALEQRLASEHGEGSRPQSTFERSFGLQVLARSRQRLSEEAQRHGREAMYQRLVGYLTVDPPVDELPAIAADLGIGTLALQVAIKRLRQRFREFVEAELAETVTSSTELEAERAALLRALAQRS
jgi:RNA polymerase sigma-70 factor (ECF subfamily)